MIFNFIQTRADDKSILKYFLPYGYMRRYLAKTYGFVVEDGVFKKRPITISDIKGFRLRDLLPLFLVMRMQCKRKACVTSLENKVNGLEKKVSVLNQDIKLLSAEFSDFRKQMYCEIERLSVENMRIELVQREEDPIFMKSDGVKE